MIAGNHNHGALEQAPLMEKAPQPAKVIVDLLDEPHIGGDDGRAHFVPGEIHALLMSHVGGVDRVRIALFLLTSIGRYHVVCVVQVVIGSGRDVGPMGLDIGKMQTPPLRARSRNELHGAVGHIGCFRNPPP